MAFSCGDSRLHQSIVGHLPCLALLILLGSLFCICFCSSGLLGFPKGCGAYRFHPSGVCSHVQHAPAIYGDTSLKTLSGGSLTTWPHDGCTAWPACEAVGPGQCTRLFSCTRCWDVVTQPSSVLYSCFRPRAVASLQTRESIWGSSSDVIWHAFLPRPQVSYTAGYRWAHQSLGSVWLLPSESESSGLI